MVGVVQDAVGEEGRQDAVATGQGGTVLFVANYPANEGYAWANIERLFAEVADVIHDRHAVRTFVAYPEIDEDPRTLKGSLARSVELDVSLQSWSSIRETLAFLRREDVDLVYFTDRELRNWTYGLLRLAGVEGVIVHDRTSGGGTVPGFAKRVVKDVLHGIDAITADRYIAVSDFVKGRLKNVARIPEAKIRRIYNGFPVPPKDPDELDDGFWSRLGVADEAPVVVCACRAAPEKGVDWLLESFDRSLSKYSYESAPRLAFFGEGPQMPELERIRNQLRWSDRVLFGGYVPDAVSQAREADLFVVPSLWEDAFPSSVLEPMAWGRPVVASAVGGIPEMVQHGETGLLVEPGDDEALAQAIYQVIRNPDLGQRFGRRARSRVRDEFPLEKQQKEISETIMSFIS